MNERELEPTIRRILVALDASPHSQAALEAASELADVLKAELVGIFVEDVNLLRLAGLPFAREVGYPSGTDRPLDSPSMERELRIQAEQARQTLAGVAVRRQIRWSFRVVRGQVATELLTRSARGRPAGLGESKLGFDPAGATRCHGPRGRGSGAAPSVVVATWPRHLSAGATRL